MRSLSPDVRRPPGPVDNVALEHIRRDPIAFLERLIDEYGPIVRHMVDGRPVVTVNSPAMVRHVLATHRGNYVKTGTPDEQMLVPLLGRGLLTSEGEEWSMQRRLAHPAFQPRQVVTFDALMAGAAGRLADSWCEKPGRVARVDHDLTSLTLTVVAQALLGSEISIGNRFGAAVDAVNRFMSHYGGEDAADRAAFRNAVGFLDSIVGLLISSAGLEGADRGDLLAQLVRARTDERPEGFSGRELRDQVITILMAGHETTAKGLTWALYLLDRHPEVLREVEDEVDRVLGGRAVTADDIGALPVCRRVVLETLRLYPPVWLISRSAVADDVIDGHLVSAGSLVCVSPWLLHRRAEEWGDDAGLFRPERFTGRPDALGANYSYLPFSAGVRHCVGQHFAMFESVLVLASIVGRARMRLVPGHPVEPEALVTLRPRHGMPMTAEPRR
jgi:cytochrome P450